MTPTQRPTFTQRVIGDGGGFVYLLASGGGPVNNPVPSVSSLSPSSTTAGGVAFTLTVNGTGFIATSVVNWNGAARTTTFVSAIQLTAAILVADIATSGTASVTVFNPTPGGGTSAPSTFTINAAGGGINFDFTTGILPGAITFSRPSIGTYNSSGNILTTASNNVARFNYVSGVANLLIEPSATNLVLNSNDFLNASWTPTGPPVITPNQFISPDGTNNGWSVAFGTGGNSLIKQVGQITFTNTLYTASIWAMRLVAAGNLRFTIGLIATGTISPTTSLVRVSVAATPAAGVGDFTVQMLGGTGTTNGLYGVQLEVGSIVTSYIPTTGSFVTRAADSATFTIPAGIGHLTFTFDDNSTQLVAVSPGSYTIPTTLNRPNLKSIVGSA